VGDERLAIVAQLVPEEDQCEVQELRPDPAVPIGDSVAEAANRSREPGAPLLRELDRDEEAESSRTATVDVHVGRG
jgi:hypothetical protein